MVLLRAGLYAAATACLGLLTACSAPSNFSLLPGNLFAEQAPSPAAPDTCSTADKCAAELKKMVKDPKRDWIGQPQSPEAYANGTRLFAYRALRKTLNCNELKRGLEDINTARPSLAPARYARAQALMTEIAHELDSERRKRCR
jgi:hypothetical protein